MRLRRLLLAALFALCASTGEAQTLFYAGSFATATTGDNTDSVTALGWPPTACFFSWTNMVADGSAAVSVEGFGAGVAAGSEFAIAYASVDADTTPEPRSRNDPDHAVMVIGTSGVPTREGDYTPTATGFDFVWALNEAASRIISYACIGGDVNQAARVAFQTLTAPGVDPIRGVGFEGDLLVLASEGGTAQDAITTTGGRFSIGMATSPTSRWAMAGFGLDGADSVTASIQVSSKVLQILASAAAVQESADFDAWDADGFDLDYDGATTARWVYGVVLKGGAHALGVDTQDSDGTPSTKTTTTTGVNPVGLMVASINQTTSTGIQSHNRFSLGAAHSTSQRWSHWAGDQHGQVTSNTSLNLDRTAVLKMMTEGTPTTQADADFSAFGTELFTLDWSTAADTTAREFVYWAPGDAVGGAPASNPPQRGVTTGLGVR